jgi:hypothetical protein
MDIADPKGTKPRDIQRFDTGAGKKNPSYWHGPSYVTPKARGEPHPLNLIPLLSLGSILILK